MFFKKKFEPDLIDLHDYEADILICKDNGWEPLPPHSIRMRMDREWTCEEMEAMRKNRRVAQEIYRRVKAEMPSNQRVQPTA